MLLTHQMRKSQMQIGEVDFYTATIYRWKKLLALDKYKQCIISSLEWLCQRDKIRVYGFVIMPNHIHLIWEMLGPNGKELPDASFTKFTSHRFLQDIRVNHPHILHFFEVEMPNRNYHFWQRDSLAVNMYNQAVCQQKLDYLHPLQERWNLAQRPEEYTWSSACFYETGVDSYGFLTHYLERF